MSRRSRLDRLSALDTFALRGRHIGPTEGGPAPNAGRLNRLAAFLVLVSAHTPEFQWVRRVDSEIALHAE